MRRYIALAMLVGIIGCQCVQIPEDALFLCEPDGSCQRGHTCIEGVCYPSDEIGMDAQVGVDAAVMADASEPGPDASFPEDAGKPDGGYNPCLPNPCTDPNKGVCTPNGNQAVCSCNAGYHDVSGSCILDQACQANSCGGHGTCSALGGVVTCVCDTGYELPYCGSCSVGYQDNDGDGICSMGCSNPGLVLNCHGHGVCDDANGTAHCVCDSNWDPSDNCNTCPSGSYVDGNGHCVAIPPDAGLPDAGLEPPDASEPGVDASVEVDAGCPFTTTLSISKTGGVVTLFNSQLLALKWQEQVSVGSGYVAKQVVGTEFTGSGQITDQVLYVNGTLSSVVPKRYPDRIVIPSSSEFVVPSGGSIEYMMYLTISGVVSGSQLRVYVRKDKSPPAGLVGSTGYVYNPSGQSLCASPDCLCSDTGPEFIWTAVANHTSPSPECSITNWGTPDYANGFCVEGNAENILVAP